MVKKKKSSKIKSKKFVVYIYQGKKGGGTIHWCTDTGTIMTKSKPFADYEEAMEAFDEILSDWIVIK